MLASVYKREYLIEDIPVTEKEIQDFHKNNIAAGTELTEEVKMAIEAALR